MSAAPQENPGARGWRAALPWWSKIAAKMVLSRLPVRKQWWQKLGLFSPGFMLDPDYAIAVFRDHYARVGSPPPGFSYLELGPGDSLASAAIAWAHGADEGWLVDAGSYAARDIRLYRALFEKLSAMRLPRDAAELMECRSVREMLSRTHCAYREDGLAGLRAVRGQSLDMIFSQAVLEHVPRAEFDATLREMKRALKPNGVGSHVVDFKDHLGASLHNLRFGEALWERPWFAKRSGFYTNRLRYSEVVAAFSAAGFAVETAARREWPALPLARARLAAPFRDLSDEDLRIFGATFVVRP
ncbi:MAG: class I SAM-dependent methyltransferase [Alphaproteobacteria bacterium]